MILSTHFFILRNVTGNRRTQTIRSGHLPFQNLSPIPGSVEGTRGSAARPVRSRLPLSLARNEPSEGEPRKTFGVRDNNVVHIQRGISEQEAVEGLISLSVPAVFAPSPTETDNGFPSHASALGHNRRFNYRENRISVLFATEKETARYIAHHIKRETKKIGDSDRPFYLCTLCQGRPFSRRGHAEIHVRSHLGVQPYCCPWQECRRRFGQKSHLSRHVKLHKGFRPHVCPECARSFAQKGNMETHRTTHQPRIKTWTCSYSKCTKKFVRKSGLARHYTATHGARRT